VNEVLGRRPQGMGIDAPRSAGPGFRTDDATKGSVENPGDARGSGKGGQRAPGPSPRPGAGAGSIPGNPDREPGYSSPVRRRSPVGLPVSE